MSAKKPVASDDLVDMELHCLTCGAGLYLALPQAHAVIASLECTGAAVLICVVHKRSSSGASSTSGTTEYQERRVKDILLAKHFFTNFFPIPQKQPLTNKLATNLLLPQRK